MTIPFILGLSGMFYGITSWLFFRKDWLLIGNASVYGIVYFIWTYVNIGKYNRKIREQYSFTETINLNWLRMILWLFLGLLSIWIVDTLFIHADIECFYLMSSIGMWMVIDFFIPNKYDVMDDLLNGWYEVAQGDVWGYVYRTNIYVSSHDEYQKRRDAGLSDQG